MKTELFIDKDTLHPFLIFEAGSAWESTALADLSYLLTHHLIENKVDGSKLRVDIQDLHFVTSKIKPE